MAIDVEQIRAVIKKKGFRWEVREHEFLRRPEKELASRLGLVIDHDRLKEHQTRAKPDILDVVSTLKGIPKRDLRSRMDERTLQLLQRWPAIPPPHPCYLTVDWRNSPEGENEVSLVRDQGGCGSCVSFGTIATLESMLLIEHDVPLDLSEAELLFCGGGSCGGWWPDNAITYLLNSGVAQEECFPYQDHNMACSTCEDRNEQAIQITTHTSLMDIAQRKQYLLTVGPMICAFAVYNDFFAYHSGVYSHVTGPLAGYHCVEVIGFNDLWGCWICKNSWGSSWGESGFFRIAYGQCEIDTNFPFWGIGGTKFFST